MNQVTAALSIFAFVAFFAFGAGPVVWTYCSEMFPPDTRARNIGFTTCANWLGNLVIAQASANAQKRPRGASVCPCYFWWWAEGEGGSPV